MTRVREVADYTDELLDTAATPDYPNAVNGLQLENSSEIRGIVAAVDFSTQAIEGAVAAKANLLVVHHGMFWAGLRPYRGASYRRLRLLIENDIAVYSSHLPLDRHSTLGNNVLLAKELGLEPNAQFAKHESVFIGVRGDNEIATAMLVERARKFASVHNGELRTTPIAKTQITRRWAICTGAGASADTLDEAAKLQVDTLIVGEGPHWTAVEAGETGLAIIYTGHYATETLGVRALAQHLGEKWSIPSSFISAPTGL